MNKRNGRIHFGVSVPQIKRSWEETERRCREAGVVFQPMIIEATGVVSAEAERMVKRLNEAVAGNTDSS